MTDQLNSLVVQLKERRANTFQDRIKSLDLRDEIWRKYIEQNKSETVDAIVAQRTGLCSDMCSERERMTREYQRFFKFYEIDSNTRSLGYSLMVTAYSRPSADQAMLSPYDLRSGPTLLRTINYLATNIMDKFDQETNKAEWYNFIWDRLRAIRKELTQQHLRDEIAIEILEQCTRFHIFCAAFLSEYSANSFDPKLNDQALIDCLNQLRDCYKVQKRLNNNQALKNLGELCSYMLLINLICDNETLLLTRQLIQTIIDQPQVKFTIEIHRALTMNNTTRFFSLIEKEATLLQSCLLHRYFSIVRLKRLDYLTSSVRGNDEFRLSDIIDILGMDDEDEARDYLQRLGYTVSNTIPPMFTVAQPIDTTDQEVKLRLSQKLIRNKYDGKLRDIITGKHETPVVLADDDIENSFDVNGAFIGRLPGDLNKISTTVPRSSGVGTAPPLRPIRPLFDPSTSSTITTTTTTTTQERVTIPRANNPILSNSFANRLNVPTARENPRFEPPHFNPREIRSTMPPNPFLQRNIFPSVVAETPRIESFRPVIPTTRPINPVIIPSSPVFSSPVLSQDKNPGQIVPPVTVVEKKIPPSSTVVDEIITGIYTELVDSIIRETTLNLHDDFVRQWNEFIGETVKIFDEIVLEEIISLGEIYFDEVEFEKKILRDTKAEHHERQRNKYLSRKYFTIWLKKVVDANEERFILNEFQEKYKFSNNEQVLEFLLGLELMSEHDLTVEQTRLLLKSRRILKRQRETKLNEFAENIFDQFLDEEFRCLILESNDELERRKEILKNSLEKQFERQRKRFLSIKFFFLWSSNVDQRKKVRQNDLISNRKRSFRPIESFVNKKRKENHQQYELIRKSFDQINSDIQQIQLCVNQLTS